MKPMARGYIHLVTFFLILFPCALLLIFSNGTQALFASLIYTGSLLMQYGISAFYHTKNWSRRTYLILRRIDHAAIFVLIAGSATPICLLSLRNTIGLQLLAIIWLVALIGIAMTTLWTHVPKWTRSLLYLLVGWIEVFYFSEIKASLDVFNVELLIFGGITYTIGALIYAFKWPNPFPSHFGYHEIFHIFVVLASGFHFILNYNLATA